jgi:hypothetical protein
VRRVPPRRAPVRAEFHLRQAGGTGVLRAGDRRRQGKHADAHGRYHTDEAGSAAEHLRNITQSLVAPRLATHRRRRTLATLRPPG